MSVLVALFMLAGLTHAAMSVQIISPLAGSSVSRGQQLSVMFYAEGAIAGISQITVSGERDGDGSSDVITYGAYPPTNYTYDYGDYTVPMDATNGESLTITVSVQGYADDPVSASVDVVAVVATPPANDNFANAILISGPTGSTTGTNVAATKETGEPNHAGYSGGKSVWWKWVAPDDAPLTIDLSGSAFDTLLGVYTGTSVSALTTIASDDQSGTGDASMLTFNPVIGTTYYIAVDGYAGDYGSIAMTWSQPVAAANGDWGLYE